MVRWMASQVGPHGRVVGVDVSDRFFEASQGANVELIKGDLRTQRLDAQFFDYVHCRLLLLHLTPADRQLILGRLHATLRPNGWIVALDPSLGLHINAPVSRADELFRRFKDAILQSTSGRADFALGPTLPDLLAEAGFDKIEHYTFFPHYSLAPDTRHILSAASRRLRNRS